MSSVTAGTSCCVWKRRTRVGAGPRRRPQSSSPRPRVPPTHSLSPPHPTHTLTGIPRYTMRPSISNDGRSGGPRRRGRPPPPDTAAAPGAPAAARTDAMSMRGSGIHSSPAERGEARVAVGEEEGGGAGRRGRRLSAARVDGKSARGRAPPISTPTTRRAGYNARVSRVKVASAPTKKNAARRHHSTLTDAARHGRRGWPRARGAAPGGERQGSHLQCARVKRVCKPKTLCETTDTKHGRRVMFTLDRFSVSRIALENAPARPGLACSHPLGADAFRSSLSWPLFRLHLTHHTRCHRDASNPLRWKPPPPSPHPPPWPPPTV